MYNRTNYGRYTYHGLVRKRFLFPKVNRTIKLCTKLDVAFNFRPWNVFLDTLECLDINAVHWEIGYEHVLCVQTRQDWIMQWSWLFPLIWTKEGRISPFVANLDHQGTYLEGNDLLFHWKWTIDHAMAPWRWTSFRTKIAVFKKGAPFSKGCLCFFDWKPPTRCEKRGEERRGDEDGGTAGRVNRQYRNLAASGKERLFSQRQTGVQNQFTATADSTAESQSKVAPQTALFCCHRHTSIHTSGKWLLLCDEDKEFQYIKWLTSPIRTVL